MATYTKFLSETKNVFVKEDGELIMQQVLQDFEDGLHCITMPTTAAAPTESTQQEYETAGDEILIWGRIGSRPNSAP